MSELMQSLDANITLISILIKKKHVCHHNRLDYQTKEKELEKKKLSLKNSFFFFKHTFILFVLCMLR